MYSICIPVYNEEESLLNITNYIISSDLWRNTNEKELIFCLNGCTDKSEKIVKLLASKISYVRIITIKEKGKNFALNKILEQCNFKSKILFFLDADIVFKDDMLSKLFECLQKNKEIVIAAANARYYPEKLMPWNFFKKRLFSRKHLQQTFIHGRGYAIRKEEVDKIKFPEDQRVYEDVYLTLKFKGKFKVVPDAIVYAKTPDFLDAVNQTIRAKIAYTAAREEFLKNEKTLIKDLDKNKIEIDKRAFWWTKSWIIKLLLHIYTDYKYKEILKDQKYNWKKLKSTKWKNPPF